MAIQNSKRGILISMTPYEKRIAVMEGGDLAELVVESAESNRVLGNIYKGVVQKVLPALKAAFIDIGLEKAGFLHQEDAIDRNILLSREYGDKDDDETVGEELSIDQILHEGQEIMVQVVKEPISTKGARLTTHLSFAGRFLVCMPNTNFIGVSKRERDPKKRREFKKVVRRLKGPDVGYIVRTNGLSESELEISKQMRELEAKWEETNFENQPAETCIFKESDSVAQTIREYFSDNTDYVYVDDRDEYIAIRKELQKLSSDKINKVKLWTSKESLFEYFKIEDDYARSLQRSVPLPHGGNLVIDQTEALVAIDVNTGPKVYGKDQEKIIFETNIDACYEIAKQLRLRDIGGLVVIDFIDMELQENRDAIYQEFRKAIRKDKAPITPTPLSQFGLMEVTRKRVRTNLMTEKTHVCPICRGTGHVFRLETTLSAIDRWLSRARSKGKFKKIKMVVSSEMVDLLCKDMARMFHYLEYKHELQLELVEDDKMYPSQFYMFNDKDEDITEEYNFV